jgi:hypothetical protein
MLSADDSFPSYSRWSPFTKLEQSENTLPLFALMRRDMYTRGRPFALHPSPFHLHPPPMTQQTLAKNASHNDNQSIKGVFTMHACLLFMHIQGWRLQWAYECRPPACIRVPSRWGNFSKMTDNNPPLRALIRHASTRA